MPTSHGNKKVISSRFVSLLEAPLLLLHEKISRLCTYSLKLTVEEVVTAIKVSYHTEKKSALNQTMNVWHGSRHIIESFQLFQVTFPLDVFSSCIKAGVQATTLFALSGTGALKKSMSRRADLKWVGLLTRFETLTSKLIDFISVSVWVVSTVG